MNAPPLARIGSKAISESLGRELMRSSLDDSSAMSLDVATRNDRGVEAKDQDEWDCEGDEDVNLNSFNQFIIFRDSGKGTYTVVSVSSPWWT